jgi:hypothetical protein
VLARPHLAAIGVVLFLIGAALLFVELRDPTPAERRPAQPAHVGEIGWPPVLDQPYPPLVLLGIDDQWHALADLKGRPVLIHVIGMGNPASNAWAGAGDDPERGFRGVIPQVGLGTLRENLQQHAGGVALDDPRFAVVHLLLADPAGHAPSVADAREWAARFGVDGLRNHLALVGDARLATAAGLAMVPGFQLLDRDLVLRRDSTGEQPKHDLHRDLLPELARMLGIAPPPAAAAGGPPDSGIPLTVDEAYAAMGHPREAPDWSGIPAEERDGLRILLAVVDEGVRLKIALWRSCTAVDLPTASRQLQATTALRSWLDQASLPPGLDEYRHELSAALAGQTAFFQDWMTKGAAFDVGGIAKNPLAQESSLHMHRAYDQLLRHFAKASAHDQKVFFGRHCALDLI